MRPKKTAGQGRRIRIAVVGLGKIGSQLDGGRPRKGLSRTHVGNILAHPRFDLVGVCDSDPKNLRKFRADWGLELVPAFRSARAMLQATAPQVTVIAAPTSAHFSLLKEALRHRPRLIVCEKPF